MLQIHKFFKMTGILVGLYVLVGVAHAAMRSNEEAKKAAASAIVVAKDAKAATGKQAATDEKVAINEKKESDAELAALGPCDIDRLGVAARRGDAGALRKLKHYGYLYSHMPRPEGGKMAFLCYDAAASTDDADSLTNLGICFFCHIGVNRDATRAEKLFTMAMKRGDDYAIYMLARCCKERRSLKEALEYYQLAADKGVSAAQAFLGLCYEQGDLGVSRDEKKAAFYFEKAAAANDSLGLTYYARCMLTGLGGTTVNAPAAIEMLKEAYYKHRCPEAGVHLAYCYANGIGIQHQSEDEIKMALKESNTLYENICQSSSKHFVHRIQRYLDKIRLGQALQECSICKEDFGSDHGVVTPCKHRFHRNCIVPWLAEHHTCPICKCTGLTEQGLRDC